MRCVAIYDMFTPERCFSDAIEDSGLFDEIETHGWMADLDQTAARALMRKIELEGPEAIDLPDDLANAMRGADVLLVSLAPVPARVIDGAPHLQYICTCRGGLENIDIAAARSHGITVFHAPAHNAVGVAEFCIGLILSETRNIARSNSALHDGIWREKYPNSNRIQELRSLTVGIIGFGNIGHLVASYLHAFGSHVCVYDPNVSDDDIRSCGCEPMGIRELLSSSDVVSLHARIRSGEPPIIGRSELAMMKPTAYLINTARSALVDMGALREALESHAIMGAGIDVYEQEPLPAGDPITLLDNVTLTSHRGGTTCESLERAPELVLSYLRDYLLSGNGHFIVG
jgi:D-3-phosphoglycerate dehydrogenase